MTKQKPKTSKPKRKSPKPLLTADEFVSALVCNIFSIKPLGILEFSKKLGIAPGTYYAYLKKFNLEILESKDLVRGEIFRACMRGLSKILIRKKVSVEEIRAAMEMAQELAPAGTLPAGASVGTMNNVFLPPDASGETLDRLLRENVQRTRKLLSGKPS